MSLQNKPRHVQAKTIKACWVGCYLRHTVRQPQTHAMVKRSPADLLTCDTLLQQTFAREKHLRFSRSRLSQSCSTHCDDSSLRFYGFPAGFPGYVLEISQESPQDSRGYSFPGGIFYTSSPAPPYPLPSEY